MSTSRIDAKEYRLIPISLATDPNLTNADESWLWVCLLLLTAKSTDGRLPSYARSIRYVSLYSKLRLNKTTAALERLRSVGYIKADADHWIIVCPPWSVDAGLIRRAWNAMRRRIAPLVFAEHGRQCVHCGSPNNLTVDHITPIALGGTNDFSNLQPLCQSCNSIKGARA